MKLPRVRFTVRRMMVAVAVVALPILAGITLQRRSHYRWVAGEFARREQVVKLLTDPTTLVVKDLTGAEVAVINSRHADYYTRMREKYERAAQRPWRIVGPDPFEPER
jgi:hypothetical protein